MSAAHAIARAVSTQHAAMLAGDPITYAQAVHTDDAQYSPEIAGVLQASRMLGFLEHDAQCMAQAWHAQTQRTGRLSLADWPSDPRDFGISTSGKTAAFAACPHSLGLYAVLPNAQWIARMVKAGVPTVQLRFKSDDDNAIRQEVRAAVQAVNGSGARLFINDHWQIAMEEGAYGVHLGQEDVDDAPLDQLREGDLRLGLSTHGYAEMLKAQALNPSYIALGAVFATTLKRMKTVPQGLGRLYAYAKLMKHLPLVAIGGIDASRLDAVKKSGVGAIAVVRAITEAPDPEAAAAKLSQQFHGGDNAGVR